MLDFLIGLVIGLAIGASAPVTVKAIAAKLKKDVKASTLPVPPTVPANTTSKQG